MSRSRVEPAQPAASRHSGALLRRVFALVSDVAATLGASVACRMAQPAARRVLIGSGLNSDSDARTLQLPHPSSGVAAAFVQLADGQLLELNWHKSAYTSWFVGDCVIEGALHALRPAAPPV